MQVISSRAAIKFKGHLRSLTPKQLSAIKGSLVEIDDSFSQEGKLSGEHLDLLAFQSSQKSILAEESFWQDFAIFDSESIQNLCSEFFRISTFALNPSSEIFASLSSLCGENFPSTNIEQELVTNVAGFRYRVAMVRYAVTAVLVLAKLAGSVYLSQTVFPLQAASNICSRLLEVDRIMVFYDLHYF